MDLDQAATAFCEDKVSVISLSIQLGFNLVVYNYSCFDASDIVLGRKQLANLDTHELFCYLKHHVIPDQIRHANTASGEGEEKEEENVVIPKNVVGEISMASIQSKSMQVLRPLPIICSTTEWDFLLPSHSKIFRKLVVLTEAANPREFIEMLQCEHKPLF